MRHPLRPGDANYILMLIGPGWTFIQEKVTASDQWTALMGQVPSWVVPALLGFSFAAFVLDPFRPQSRLKEAWRAISRRFEVVNVYVTTHPKWHEQLVVRLRFTREIRTARLRLRVYRATGMKRPPLVGIYPLAELTNVAKDHEESFILAEYITPHPGWTPQHSCWVPSAPGERHTRGMVGHSRNVAVLELVGVWPPQSHRIFVRNPTHGTEDGPKIYAHDEDEDLFNVRPI